MTKRSAIAWILVPVVLAAAGVAGWNYQVVQRPLSNALAADSRNTGLSVFAHYKWFVNPRVLVFDLRGVSGSNSEADVMRTLLQVILAYKGQPRFLLEGSYFRQLGAEYDYQNPVYTLRTFPEHVLNLDGTHAFGSWSGGLLGVVSHQMADLNDFGKQWFLADASAGP
jgi:hypothetical protein